MVLLNTPVGGCDCSCGGETPFAVKKAYDEDSARCRGITGHNHHAWKKKADCQGGGSDDENVTSKFESGESTA